MPARVGANVHPFCEEGDVNRVRRALVRRRSWLAVLALVPATVVVAGTGAGASVLDDSAPAGAPSCEDQPTTRVAGTVPDQFTDLRPRDNRTYDLRDATFAGPPVHADPVAIGQERAARYTCVRGGTILGQPEITDLWRGEVYNRYGGYGLGLDIVGDHPSVVDGLRVDRLLDGFGPAGDGTVLRNAYISDIRDDCVEADYLSAGRIENSLLDGCYAGISVDPVVRPSPRNPEPLVLDGVLMRLKPYANNPVSLQTIRLFKSENWANVVVRNSVFLADKYTVRAEQFRSVQAENVTVVWLGDGTFPGTVPPGVTVVTDLKVWEQAREAWLRDHGYDLLPAGPALFPAPSATGGPVSLEWTFGGGATSYRVNRAVSKDGPYQTLAEVDATTRTYTDTAVEPGVRYYYRVSAVNAHGQTASNLAIAVPVSDTAGAPAQVRNLVARMDPNPHGQHVLGEGRVELTWNHVAGAESYVVRRGTAPGQYTNEFVTRDNRYVNAGIRPQGATYYYEVVAQNRHGRGAPSGEASATPERVSRDLSVTRFDAWQLPADQQPAGLPAVAGDGRITLSWLFPRDASGDVSFRVKRSTTPGGPYEQVAEIPPAAPNVAAPSYTDTGLQNGVTYYYVVQSVDGAGSSPDSEEISETPQATPVVPGAPSRLVANTVHDRNAVRLSWDAADLASAYTVERATSPSGPFEPVYRVVRGTTFTDYGVRSGQRYVYRVRGVNSFGEGEASPVARVALGSVDHVVPVVSVSGVEDGAAYLLGAVPKPRSHAGDNRGVAWKNDQLRRPATKTGAGQYTFVASAGDEATNESIVYATYSVRYRFSGLLGALGSPGASFPLDQPLPVEFRLTDSRHEGVGGAKAEVLVDGVPAEAWGDPQKAPKGSYRFLLDPLRLSAEFHTLTVVLDDGTTHTTTFRLS